MSVTLFGSGLIGPRRNSASPHMLGGRCGYLDLRGSAMRSTDVGLLKPDAHHWRLAYVC